MPGGPVKKFLEEIFSGIDKSCCRVRLLRPNAYNVSWEEIVSISQIVAFFSPQTLFEFGTFNGRTTLHLALNAPDHAVVYSIDVNKGPFEFGADTPFFTNMKVGECFFGSSVEKKIVMLTGDSKQFDFTQFANRINFVFIDGDHSYDAVMNDSKIAFQMVSSGGIIVWHDYLFINDVTRAILDISKGRELFNLKNTSLVIWQKP
jgi:predicted O-methyltransferase YrrM